MSSLAYAEVSNQPQTADQQPLSYEKYRDQKEAADTKLYYDFRRALRVALTGDEYKLFDTLVDRVNHDKKDSRYGKAFTSYSGLSKLTGMSNQSISKALKRLEDLGLIELDRRPGDTTFYVIREHGSPALIEALKNTPHTKRQGGFNRPKDTFTPSTEWRATPTLNGGHPSTEWRATPPLNRDKRNQLTNPKKESKQQQGEAPVIEAQTGPTNVVVVDKSFFSDKAREDLTLIRELMPDIELKKAEKLARLEKGEARIRSVAAAARKRADENPEGYFIRCLENGWNVGEAPAPKTQPTQAYLEKQARLQAEKAASALKDEAAQSPSNQAVIEVENPATPLESEFKALVESYGVAGRFYAGFSTNIKIIEERIEAATKVNDIQLMGFLADWLEILNARAAV